MLLFLYFLELYNLSMKIIGVYKIVNVITEECYVGSSTNVVQRWQTHKQPNSTSRLVREAMDFYGRENFKLEILEECNAELLKEREHCWISTLNPAYNIRGKGKNINSVSEETKKRISEAQKGRAPWNVGIETSEETKAKLSAALKAVSATRDMSDNGRHRPIKCVETGQVFASIREASTVTDIPYKGIQKVLAGVIKKTHGYSFIYVEKTV